MSASSTVREMHGITLFISTIRFLVAGGRHLVLEVVATEATALVASTSWAVWYLRSCGGVAHMATSYRAGP